MSEDQPLLAETQNDLNAKTTYQKFRGKTGDLLQCALFHELIITLTATDAILVLIDIGYTIIAPGCKSPGEQSPYWLEILSRISLVITTLFLVELPLTVWSLGFQYMDPFGTVPHARLHFFDAIVILTTFILEAVLRGRERELAGLFVILRLWRLVKLVGGVAISTEELEEENARELAHTKGQLVRFEAELAKLREENTILRQRCLAIGNSPV